MLFKEGTYKHETGFTILVDKNGMVMLSPNHPLSIRLEEMFDPHKWTKVNQKGSD